jgi:hypothetical protein
MLTLIKRALAAAMVLIGVGSGAAVAYRRARPLAS